MSSKAMGRPPIPIDWNEVDRLLEANCSGSQIASTLGITAETLYERCLKDRGKTFSIYSHEKKEKGDSSLLGKQHAVAMKGNVTMLIWLGKQRLKQKEPDAKDFLSEEQMSNLEKLATAIDRISKPADQKSTSQS